LDADPLVDLFKGESPARWLESMIGIVAVFL